MSRRPLLHPRVVLLLSVLVTSCAVSSAEATREPNPPIRVSASTVPAPSTRSASEAPVPATYARTSVMFADATGAQYLFTPRFQSPVDIEVTKYVASSPPGLARFFI